jgi:site-specific DNA recombinase
MQLRDLAQLADRRQFRLYKEYCDEGVSGAKATRSALEAVLADAKKAKFGAILIWKLDRLGRSLAHLVRLLEDFRSWNVELISFSEGLDFSTSTGKLLYQMISAFAEFERDCVSERVRAGLGTPGQRENTSDNRRSTWTASGSLDCAHRATPGTSLLER